jgi:tetratricopeptide (TPR) repeat protein
MSRTSRSIADPEDRVAVTAINAQEKFRQAISLHKKGHLQQAQVLHEEILAADPNSADSLHLLGVICCQTGSPQKAVELIRGAIGVDPNNVAYHSSLGNVLQLLRQFEAAVASYDKAVELKEDYAEAHCNRGVALAELKQRDAAVASFDKAIAAKAEYASAHYNRANVLKELGQLDAAVASYDKAIALRPGYAEAYANRGIALQEMGRLDAAVSSFDEAIGLKADYAEAYSSRGFALQELRRIEAAGASYDQAINIRPDFADAKFNKSLLCLSRGDFESGWQLYDWRWRTEKFPSRPLITTRPKWTAGGEKKRVLVWAEQGIGDELMFSALLPEFRALCSTLIVRSDHRLIPLLMRSMPRDLVFVPSHQPLDENDFDEHLPMGDLCGLLRPNESAFAATRAGYLVDDSERTKSVRAELSGNKPSHQTVCGISWRSKNEKTGARRSFDLKTFFRLLALDGVKFVNLQYGSTAEEIAAVKRELGVDVLCCQGVDNFNDIDGLASLIQACDVVVSVDNSTVQLAGALGKDVRVLLPYFSDWRWLLDRDDSLWYQSARLYRQEADGQWAPVFQKLRADLLLPG